MLIRSLKTLCWVSTNLLDESTQPEAVPQTSSSSTLGTPLLSIHPEYEKTLMAPRSTITKSSFSEVMEVVSSPELPQRSSGRLQQNQRKR